MGDELEQRAAEYLSSVLGFNGERIDPVLGGYHLGNGYRLYSPGLRRFTSPDSMSPFGKGGINPYAYCEGDPVNNTDPTGRVRLSRSLVDLTLGIVIDDPELIADAALRDEAGHLGARAARQVASEDTRPRASSFSAETEHTTRRRERVVRENRAVREAQRPGPSNISPHPSTDTRMRELLAEPTTHTSWFQDLLPQHQSRVIQQNREDMAYIFDNFRQKKGVV